MIGKWHARLIKCCKAVHQILLQSLFCCLTLMDMFHTWFHCPTCRAVADALLTAIHQLRDGATFFTGVIPLPSSTCPPAQDAVDQDLNNTGAAAAPSTLITTAGHAAKPSRPLSAATAAGKSDFSFGSDAVSVAWHAGGPVDIKWCSQLLVMIMTTLRHMQRWNSLMRIGVVFRLSMMHLAPSQSGAHGSNDIVLHARCHGHAAQCPCYWQAMKVWTSPSRHSTYWCCHLFTSDYMAMSL